MKNIRIWRLTAVATVICGVIVLTQCASCSEEAAERRRIRAIADSVWIYSQRHPEGFTLRIDSMTQPRRGIMVSYAATQGCHERSQLDSVVRHALHHDGYVGGWPNSKDGCYYFDSSRLFAEDSLAAALNFARKNGQCSVYILSLQENVPTDSAMARIVRYGSLIVGSTGDYRPLSYCEPETQQWWGFDIDVLAEIAWRIGIRGCSFFKTTWPTLTADVTMDHSPIHLAIGGITITDARRQKMLMSEGYLANGKTILCRAADSLRFRTLAAIDRPDVRVIVNPGGLNEQFAIQRLPHATLLRHERNEEIPALVATGRADVMITEITEAPYYVRTDSSLAAPLLDAPFTHSEIGVLMRKGQDDLLRLVNTAIRQMKTDGTLRRLCEKYGLAYTYE